MLFKKYLSITIQLVIIFSLCVLILIHLLTNIIDWYYPDSIVQIDFIKRSNLLGAIYANWAHTSIGRPGGVFWIDTWFYFSDLFNLNNLYSLLFYRSFSFFITGLSIVFLIKYFLNLKLIFSIFVSLLIFIIFILSLGQEGLTFIWGMDLSLYVVSFVYLNLTIIFGHSVYTGNINKLNIFFLSFFYFLYLNSSYAHLVTGGLLVVILLLDNKIFYYLKNPNSLFKEFFLLRVQSNIKIKYKILIFLIFIFIISAILNLLSPSISIRENIWPSDSSFLIGILSSLPLLEWHLLSVWGYKYLFISLLVLFIIKYKKIDIKASNTLLTFLIVLTPFLLVLTNSLAYLSSSLHINYDDTNDNIFIFKYLVLDTDLNHASAMRHYAYYNINAILSYISLGLLMSKIKIKKDN